MCCPLHQHCRRILVLALKKKGLRLAAAQFIWLVANCSSSDLAVESSLYTDHGLVPKRGCESPIISILWRAASLSLLWLNWSYQSVCVWKALLIFPGKKCEGKMRLDLIWNNHTLHQWCSHSSASSRIPYTRAYKVLSLYSLLSQFSACSAHSCHDADSVVQGTVFLTSLRLTKQFFLRATLVGFSALEAQQALSPLVDVCKKLVAVQSFWICFLPSSSRSELMPVLQMHSI